LGDRGVGSVGAVGPSALDGQQVRFLQSLQGHYGNDHVARVVRMLREGTPAAAPPLTVQLQVACPAPPQAPVSKPPAEDPKFKAVESKIQSAAADQRRHPSARSKVAEAQGAAVPPGNDTASQAQAAQADKMGDAKPGVFDKAAFIAAVNKAIADASPKTLEEADEFSSSGKAGEVRNQVIDKVTKGKDDSAKDVKEKTGEAPDPSTAKPKPVTPMAEEKPGPKPQDPGAASAMPAPAPAEQTNLGAGKCETEQKMADAEVTEEHLKKSNEPQMQQAVEAKKEGEEHSAKAPADVKAQEDQKLQTAQTAAASGTATALDAMHQKKTAALGHVGGDKGATKAKDEAKRAEVSTHIEGIFTATKTEVDGILTGLDAKVSEAFTKGEAEARKAFEQNHKAEMERWKDERYSGITGAAQWIVDKIKGLPPEANDIYVRARNLYLSKMNQTIADVADIVGGELTRAKNRINQGRDEIKKYVAGLGPELKKFGAEAERNVASKFEDLDKDVDAKKDAVVSDLAQRYVEARNSVDASIKQMQDENKGLWDKAKAVVGDAIEAILKLKDLFMGLLAKAAGAFTKILSDPLAFISNFMGALKQGFMNFASNILEHLKKGLMGWLFGALAEAGIEIPETFDFKGILKLVLSILGLTWPAIKAFIAKAFPWAAKVIDFIESKVEIIGIIVKEGVGGLWKWIKDKIGDLKDMILTPIKDFIVEKVVKAGITWVLGMLNPAGALIKIVQALISVVQWIMERGAALMDFVGTVVDAVSDIASGGMGGVPAKIEAALGRAVPLVISFLAGLLGLGGISDMIKSTFDKVRKPVMNVVHAVVGAAVKGAKNLIKGIKGMFGKKKDKETDESEKIKDEAKEKLVSAAPSLHNAPQLHEAVGRIAGDLRPRGLKSLRLVPAAGEDHFDLVAEASPAKKKARVKITRDQKASVTVNASATFDKPPKIEEKFGSSLLRDAQGKPVLDESGKPVMEPGTLPATIESTAGYRKVPSAAGGIILPESAGSTEVKLRTWNTGDPVKQSSASHAENQLANWLTSRADPSATVVDLKVVLTGKYSPCPGCAAALRTLGALLKERAASRSKTVVLSIDYTAVKNSYPAWSSPSECAGALAGWGVNGAPPKEDAEATVEVV
jgi:hypothetical protein